MKKKILGGIAILAIAALAAFNVNLNLAQESNMSPLALANVEALAQSEGGGGTTYYVNPCPKHSGNECSSKSSPYGCKTLSYC
jgi:hypothetical protein